MPFFCRHSRIAEIRGRAARNAVPLPGAPLVEVAALVAAAFDCEVVLTEEPPHAARPSTAATNTATTPAAGVRRAFLI
jgi:hypothetical protein